MPTLVFSHVALNCHAPLRVEAFYVRHFGFRRTRVTVGPLSFDAVIPGWRTGWVADPERNIVAINQGFTDQAEPPAAPG